MANPDIESYIDILGGAKFITVCDVQSACHKTALLVTSKGKYVFKVLPFGIANVSWVFISTFCVSRAHLRYFNVLCPLRLPTLKKGLACWYMYGRCYNVFFDVGSSPRIIRGYVPSTSSSRFDIEALQNPFWA